MNEFLEKMKEKWGEDTVFDPTNPDYAKALSAIVSTINRSGNINDTTKHFLTNKPSSLADVEARYKTAFNKVGHNWHLVLEGAKELEDLCFPAGTMITLADGSQKVIEDITTSDKVLTFSDNGKPCAGEVVRLYRNTTPEFIRLTFDDGRANLVTSYHECEMRI